MPMNRRTTIEIDDVLLRAAQEALGTKGLKDTIDLALTEAVRTRRRARLAEALRRGDAFDLASLDREGLWRR
jgi:Arc/MetJ family transcription regulator